MRSVGPGAVLAILALSLLVVESAIANEYKVDPAWLLSNKPLDIPLEIHVALVGKANIRKEELQTLLDTHLPDYRVSDIETKQMSQIQFTLNYQIEQTSEDKLLEYEKVLSMAIKESERSASDGLVYVNTDSLVSYFGRLHIESMRTVKREDQFYSVFIVAPDRSRLNFGPAGGNSYVYSTGHGRRAGSGVWIGPGRWVVIDLSAMPVEYGSTEGHNAFTSISLPYFDPKRPEMQTLLGPAEVQLSVVITNAVKNVFASDLKFHLLRDESKIVVPIVLLRNHDMFDPFKEPGHEYSIEIETIKQEISQLLLPGQKLEIVTASHSLHEHKSVSMSVFKALKTVSHFQPAATPGLFDVITSTYLDGAVLEYEFKRAGDLLFSGLIRNYNQDSSLFGFKKLKGPRILPVYVVSLVGVQDSLTMENSALYRASENVVIALQTNDTQVNVPFFYKHAPLPANGMRITRHIIAGLAQAMGAVSDPTTHFSVIHQSERTDYTFAFGYHPFGHFSQSEQVSKVLADAVIRNHIISRVDFAVITLRATLNDMNNFAKDYMYNPLGGSVKYVESKSAAEVVLGTWTDQLFSKAPSRSKLRETITALKTQADQISSQLQIVAHLLSQHDFDKAYEISKSFQQATTALQAYVKDQLTSVELDLVCCYLHVDSAGESTTSWFGTWFVLLSFALLGLVIFWLLVPRDFSIGRLLEHFRASMLNRHSGNSAVL